MEKKMNLLEDTLYAIARYEDELPDLLKNAKEDYENGFISPDDYANALRKIYTIIEMLYLGGNK